MLWSDSFEGHLFADNEGTKFSLLRGVSDNECVNKLVQAFGKHETLSATTIWISRAASHSNIADGQSRNKCNLLCFD